MTQEKIYFEDYWIIGKGEFNGVPSLLRFRNKLEQLMGHPSYSKRLEIRWEYEVTNESGMPDERTLEIMSTFDNRLFEALEDSQNTIFVAIETHNGLKKWMGYCRNVEELEDLINTAFKDDQIYPIKIGSFEDPDWLEYQEILKGTKGA